ncbi:LPS translocon maturation chaperone LptM [Amphritea balenae]|uniref:Lipopeptide n=1 Tax=Amphritea balenae TaxID=452629 RepID=A0A3P1SIP1_9GAMM|nr:lipoprotein [Amphritea balenae]RRC97161.1 lipopeptide [Amphritea balenae]
MKACWIAIFFSALLISGCGQKGPLYLPSDAPQQTQLQSQQ